MKGEPGVRAGARCPACRYALAGIESDQCPECGGRIDDAWLRRCAQRQGRGHRWRRSIALLVPLMYMPYGWLLFVSPGSHRSDWLTLWPGLPALFPGHFLVRHLNFAGERVALIAMTIPLVAIVLWAGARSRRWWIATAVVVGGLSLLNAWGAYHAYRM